MPITWKNVSGRSDAVAADFMRQAGTYLNKGLESVNQIVEDQSARVQDRDMATFNEALSRYQTPEQLAAAQESGAIADLRGRLQYLDPNKTGADAIRNRLTGLREQETADYNYNQTLQKRADQPFLEQINRDLSGISMNTPQEEAAKRIESIRQQAIENGASNRVLTQLNQDSRKLLEAIETESYSDWKQGREIDQAAREDRERATTKRLNTLEGQLVTDYTAGQKQGAERRATIAADVGVPVVNGVPALDQASTEQLQQFQTRMQATESPMSYKDAEKRYAKALTDAGVGGDDYSQRMASFRARMKMPTEITDPANKQQLESGISAATAEKETRLSRLNEERQRFFNSNGFISDKGADPNMTASDVLSKINDESFASEDGWDLFGWLSDSSNGFKREEVTKSVGKAMTSGLDINGQTIRASEGMVRMAFQAARQNEDPKASFEGILRDIMSQPENIRQWESAQGAIERFQEREDAINTAFIKSTSALKTAAKQREGITPEYRAMFDQRLERALARKPDMSEKEQKKTVQDVAKDIKKEQEENPTPVNPPAPESTQTAPTPNNTESSVGSNLGALLGGFIKAPNVLAEDNLVRQGWENIGDWVNGALDNTTVSQLPQYSNMSEQQKQPIKEYARDTLQKALDNVRKGVDVSMDNSLPELIKWSIQNDTNKELVEGLLKELRR